MTQAPRTVVDGDVDARILLCSLALDPDDELRMALWKSTVILTERGRRASLAGLENLAVPSAAVLLALAAGDARLQELIYEVALTPDSKKTAFLTGLVNDSMAAATPRARAGPGAGAGTTSRGQPRVAAGATSSKKVAKSGGGG
jgi:hypothetical protein